MHWLIVGAGGIGSTYGTRLAAIGETVTFTARGAHLAAMQERGLRVEHPTFTFEGPVDAIDDAALLGGRDPDAFDAILVTLKTHALLGWLAGASAWLARGTAPVVSLQNGVDAEAWIAEVVGGARTFGGLAVEVGAHVEAPGHVVARGDARVVLGPWPDGRRGEADPYVAQDLADVLERAGVPATATQRIETELWRKWMINVALNPLSALLDLETRALVDDPAYAPVVEGIMREVHAVGVASGVALGEDDVASRMALMRGFEAIRTSMQVDRAQGRPLELEAMSGGLLARAAAQGVPAPTTALVDALLRRAPDVVVA